MVLIELIHHKSFSKGELSDQLQLVSKYHILN